MAEPEPTEGGAGGSITRTSTTGLCSWSGWAGVTTSAKTLSLLASVQVDSGGGTSHNSVSYTLDGSTWTTFFSSNTTLASATYSVAIPSGTNLGNVQVQAASYSTVPSVDGDSVDATITISQLQIA